MRNYYVLSSQNIQEMKYIESKNGNKMKNVYSHKIITRINQIESKYGNKIGSELEANLLPIETQKVKKLKKS